MMLYLNNKLLTSERIITWFEQNIVENRTSSIAMPSPLALLKNKLKAIFFADLHKTASDHHILATLETDTRFTSNYPKLKQILNIIFELSETDDKRLAFEKLNSIDGTDWDTTTANSRFDELNQQYSYFDDTQEAVRTQFIELAISCRTLIVLFEKNNTAEDTMAYEYAYKLMAIFLNPTQVNSTSFDTLSRETHKLVTQCDSPTFHDALLVKLEPLPHATEFTDKEGWRAFIKKEGVKAFPFFIMANNIEEAIKNSFGETAQRAPKSLNEAKSMVRLCSYTRVKEDEAFAQICYNYNVSEARFNCCLDIMNTINWPQNMKSSDFIPNITITGVGDMTGLYWLKVPPKDKRALILGDITYCCQSIGGNAEPCVLDAITLPNNGLYVLVKQRKANTNALIIDGEINDKDFKIIGQSYIWKSKNQNICLDSIEYLKDEVTHSAIKSIITEFANTLLQENPDIRYVTLGQGGKTPENLFANASVAEEMREGLMYGDANHQYCVAKTPHARLTEAQSEALDRLLSPYPSAFRTNIHYLSVYLADSEHIVEKLRDILEHDPSLANDLITSRSVTQFIAQRPLLSTADFNRFDFDAFNQQSIDAQNAILDTLSLRQLLWRATNAERYLCVIRFIPLKNFFKYITMKDANGAVPLHYPTDNPVFLISIWKRLSEKERCEALRVQNYANQTVLQCAAGKSPEYLIAFINGLTKNQRLSMVMLQDEHGKTILNYAVSNPAGLLAIVNCLPESQRLRALQSRDKNVRNTVLYYAASNGTLLVSILNVIPENQRLDALMTKDNDGKNILHYHSLDRDYLIEMVCLLPENQRFDALMSKNKHNGFTVFNYVASNPARLLPLLQCISQSQCYALLKEKDQHGATILSHTKNNQACLDAIWNHLPEDKQIEVKNDYPGYFDLHEPEITHSFRPGI